MMDLDSYQPQVVPRANDPLQIQTNLNGGTVVDLEDFDPQPRDRCNTWPLQRPSGELSHNTSPLIHEEIPEESSLHGSQDSVTLTPPDSETSPNSLSHLPSDDGSAGGKKNTARRNAWGNLSYADLITQAILNSPEKRLTLSQVYDWMVQNVPYFRDKGDSNSSAGWKNSIRHNLSLHSRFMRIQNEGAGKSSWWVINPDAKPGKASRRRAQTMDTKPMEKKRVRAKKKVELLRNAALANAAAAAGGDMSSVSPAVSSESSDTFFDGIPNFPTGEFRTRSNSNLSNYSLGTGRLSPPLEEAFDDFSWGIPHRGGIPQQDLNSDIMDMASMRLADQHPPTSLQFGGGLGGGLPDQKHPPPSYGQATSRFQSQMRQPSPLKVESSNIGNSCSMRMGTQQQTQISPSSYHQVPIPPTGTTPLKQDAPPAYTELYPTTYGKIQANPALRDALKSGHHPGMGFHQGAHFGATPPNYGVPFPQPSNGAGPNGQLPQDIQDVHYDTNLQCDIDAVIRHELNVAGNLDFNMDTYGNC